MIKKCKHGHVMKGSNVYMRKDGRGRQCRVCQAARIKAWRAKQEK